ncbi:MAG: TolC family protein [Betaproteobacteria bacterium]|nr:TolC family protein [Betaproteobacteria bacterium]
MSRSGVDGLRLDCRRGAAWLSAVAFTAAAAVPVLAGEPGLYERAPPGGWRPDLLAQSVVVRTLQVVRVTPLQELIGEALRNNPEIAAAAHERDAAGHRISPAGALEDPMLEAGFLNLPTDTWRFNAEEMTMKMLGVAQKLPYPGKRALRQDVAAKNAESVAFGYRESVSRVVRAVKVAYYDLALVDRSIELVQRNKLLVEQLLRIAEGRYSVGQGSQADVLKAQTQLAKMEEELVRMGRERRTMEADLAMALGRGAESAPLRAAMPQVEAVALKFEELQEAALRQRPQLLGLKSLIEKNQKALDLARKEYYPDFDVRFSYGQRDKMPDGTPRPDMISLTVGINLPIWQKNKIDPMIAEAQSMREAAISMYEAQRNELLAKLRQQVAIAQQSSESARLFETGILPQARLSVESALSAYRVSRVDFPMLLDSQMAVFNYEINHATTVVAFNKALAEIDQLTGKSVPEAQSASSQGEKR